MNLLRYPSAQVEELLSITDFNAIACIAGSYPLSLVTTNTRWKPTDIDVFTYTDEGFDIIHKVLRLVRGYQVVAETINAVTFKKAIGLPIQLIRPRGYRDASEVLGSFDIGLSMCQLVSTYEVNVAKPIEVENNLITFHKSSGILLDVQRLMKYTAKGYSYEYHTLLTILGLDHSGYSDTVLRRKHWEVIYP